MKLVILDRDGVINEDSDHFVRTLAQWKPLPGAIEAIARLSRAGYDVYVATNQSGVGRGLIPPGELEAMHRRMVQLVEEQGGRLAGIYYCPHVLEDGCGCRKPKPGLLDRIRADAGVAELTGVPLIGDSLRDLEAAAARGCRPILVRTGKGRAAEAALHESPHLAGVAIYDDLAAAAQALLTGP